jgi:hypothetical protein
MFIVALNTLLTGICYISLLMIIGYSSYRFINFIEDHYLNNELSYPPKCNRWNQVFDVYESKFSCNQWARGLFLLYTGIKVDAVDYIQSHGEGYQFDDQLSSSQKVHLLVYLWPDKTQHGSTELCHECLYYKGYLYQSYRTQRFDVYPFLFSKYRDAYPPLRISLPEELCHVFTKYPDRLTVKQFNEWCAPRDHPIDETSPLRLFAHYQATLNPIRDNFSLQFSSSHK